MGYDVVIIETVGVGQDEVDVVSQAETAVVVTVPGLGDDIQAIKAGILEIADVLVVNKADREGADRTVRDLTHMLELRGGTTRAADVEIVRTIATTGAGLDELIGAVERHEAVVKAGGESGGARSRARRGADRRARQGPSRRGGADVVDARGGLATLAGEVAARRRDPYGAAEEIVRAVLGRSA